MRKTPLLLSALSVVLLGALSLGSSVAQLQEAASSLRAAPSATASVIVGPRYKSVVTVRAAAPAEGPEPSRGVPVTHDLRTPLERLLDTASMEERHRRMTLQVLGLLPEACQEKLQTFSVLYNHPKSRGLAGNGVIIVSGNVPDREFMGLLLHEGLGHFYEITCLEGTKQSGQSAFRDGADPVWNDDPSVEFYAISWINELTRKPDAQPEDFVTGYAYEGDNFEDLAESITYYLTQREPFEERAADNPVLAQKLAWLERNFPVSKTVAVATGDWSGTIAWDATKLGFEWVGR